jgi:hypothetical protein
MKIILASILAAGVALSSGAALAQSASVTGDLSFSGLDTDRNGTVSWTEFSLVYTDYTEEQFNSAEVNGDGELSIEEFDSLALATGSIRAPLVDEATPVDTSSLSSTNAS